MRIATLTLFPSLFEAYIGEGLFAKAVESRIIELDIIDIRDFAKDKHRTADDIPFGGGAGMVMKPEPIVFAAESLYEEFSRAEKIIVSPRGQLFDQREAERLSELESLVVICGRYKGIDGRIPDMLGAREVSLGDYVLGSGEIAAMAIIDAIARLIPGYLGDLDSAETDSHSGPNRLLSAPEYTRPREFRGHRVPEILLSGNHSAIENWKRRQSLRLTLERRPEILRDADLTQEDIAYLEALKKGRIERE